MEQQSIVILDFGSQFTQLIARRIREQNVFSVVLPCTASLDEIKAYKPVGIILSGGPCSVYDTDAPPADEKVLHLGLPVLGICYGLHWMTYKLGGKVEPGKTREYGHAQVTVSGDSRLFRGLPPEMKVWMSHGDVARELPAGFQQVGQTSTALAAMEDPKRRYWAVQFHPEVHHTPLGKEVLKNFVFGICEAKPNWTPHRFIDESIRQIKETVGEQGHAELWVGRFVGVRFGDNALRVEQRHQFVDHRGHGMVPERPIAFELRLVEPLVAGRLVRKLGIFAGIGQDVGGLSPAQPRL